MVHVIALIGLVILSLFAGFDIKNAIEYYQSGEYGKCGLFIVTTIILLTFMIKIIFVI